MFFIPRTSLFCHSQAKERQSIESRLQAKLSREQGHGRKRRKLNVTVLQQTEKEFLHIGQHCTSQSSQHLVISLIFSHVKHRYSLIPNLANFLLITEVMTLPEKMKAAASPIFPRKRFCARWPLPLPPNTAYHERSPILQNSHSFATTIPCSSTR